MDIDFYNYKRARGIKHKAAIMPFYPRPPAPVPAEPAQAGGKAKPAAAPWPAPTPPASVVTVEVVSGGVGTGGGDADVDRRAAMYISRVKERLRRERMTDDWRKYY